MDFILFLLAVGLSLIPAIVAGMRGHRHTGAIVVLCLLLGWTVIGWAVAMVWACMDQTKPPPSPVPAAAPARRHPLEGNPRGRRRGLMHAGEEPVRRVYGVEE